MDGARYQFEIKEGKQLRRFEISNPDQYFAATPFRFLQETWRLLLADKK